MAAAKILITGGSGFIGLAVAQALVKAGHEVHTLDTYDASAEHVKYFRGSVLDQAAIRGAMEGCDYVIHLAAMLGVLQSTTKALECLDVNILGTRNVLECSVQMKIKRFILSSSSEVYGEPNEVPIKETTVLSPKSEYGVSKVVGEEYCRAYERKFGLPYTIIRFFNVYGAGQRDDFVMSAFTNAALQDQPLSIHGDGSQVRAFCYVDDMVDGVMRILFSGKTVNQTFNLGNPTEPISMYELAKRIVRHAGKPESLIRKIPFEASDRTAARDILQRFPDISKIQKVIDFVPKISLDEGIQRILAYKKAQMLSKEKSA